MLLFVDSQFLSPYAMSAFVALREKNLHFELRTIHLHLQENRGSEFSTLSLTNRVPTLADGEYSISESSAISEYAEEISPMPRIYPHDVRERGRARQIQAWLRSDLLALRQERPTEVIFQKPSDNPLTELGQASAEKLVNVAGALLSHGQLNLFKDWCIADLDLALMLNRLVANGDDVPHSLQRYVAHQWERPAIQEWVELQKLSKI